MTGGAVYELMDEQPSASIRTLPGFYSSRLHNESQRMQAGAAPPQQCRLDFCLKRRPRCQVSLNLLPHGRQDASEASMQDGKHCGDKLM